MAKITVNVREEIPGLPSTVSLIDFIQELDMTDKGNVIDKAILCLANKMKLLEKEEIEVAMENDLL